MLSVFGDGEFFGTIVKNVQEIKQLCYAIQEKRRLWFALKCKRVALPAVLSYFDLKDNLRNEYILMRSSLNKKFTDVYD